MKKDIDIRKERVGEVMSKHITDKYDGVLNTRTYTFSWGLNYDTEFHFIIDVDFDDHIINRKIRKEVYNLCRYILGEREVITDILFNKVKHIE